MVCLVWAGNRFGWFVWFGLAICLSGLSGLGWLSVWNVCLVWAGYRFGWLVWFGLAKGLFGLPGLD